MFWWHQSVYSTARLRHCKVIKYITCFRKATLCYAPFRERLDVMCLGYLLYISKTSSNYIVQLNSVWPTDAPRWHRSGLIMVQAMACCLMAPRHHLVQCFTSSVKPNDVHLKYESLKISPQFPNVSQRCPSNFPEANELIHNDVIKFKHFRVIGSLCGKFGGDRWIPRKKASDVELWYFLWSAPE